MNAIHTTRGLTIIELIVAIAVVAILLTLGVPSVQQTINNNRITAQNNELVALLSFARSESIRRNENVIVDLTAAGDSWSGNVRVADGQTTPGCPPGAIRCADNSSVKLNQTRQLVFNNRGYLTPFDAVTLTLTHQPCKGNRQHREIEILGTGHISSTAGDCP